MNTTEIGLKLVSHSKATHFSANRGLVAELYPFILEASERMSSRAISRFLAKEQNIRLSAVTITKALNDPKKSWNAFFDTIEESARIFSAVTGMPMKDFLYRDKNIQDSDGFVYRNLNKRMLGQVGTQADLFLRAKWFSIDLRIRMKAGAFLAERIGVKTGK